MFTLSLSESNSSHDLYLRPSHEVLVQEWVCGYIDDGDLLRKSIKTNAGHTTPRWDLGHGITQSPISSISSEMPILSINLFRQSARCLHPFWVFWADCLIHCCGLVRRIPGTLMWTFGQRPSNGSPCLQEVEWKHNKTKSGSLRQSLCLLRTC